MSLFSSAGKKFEAAKQAVTGGEEPEFRCRSCEEPVSEAHDHCPHCGEPTVEPVE